LAKFGSGCGGGGTGTWHGKTLPLRKGLEGAPLSRRRTCPDLAPYRLDAGRLSWLQRAGPSTTLDKHSSVVGGIMGQHAAASIGGSGPGRRIDGPCPRNEDRGRRRPAARAAGAGSACERTRDRGLLPGLRPPERQARRVARG